jgi:hypothetical protein
VVSSGHSNFCSTSLSVWSSSKEQNIRIFRKGRPIWRPLQSQCIPDLGRLRSDVPYHDAIRPRNPGVERRFGLKKTPPWRAASCRRYLVGVVCASDLADRCCVPAPDRHSYNARPCRDDVGRARLRGVRRSFRLDARLRNGKRACDRQTMWDCGEPGRREHRNSKRVTTN